MLFLFVIVVDVTIGRTSPDVTGTDDGGDPLPLPRSPHLQGCDWSTAPLRGHTLEIHSPMLEMMTALCFHCGCGPVPRRVWAVAGAARGRAGPVLRDRGEERPLQPEATNRDEMERKGWASSTGQPGSTGPRPGWSELAPVGMKS